MLKLTKICKTAKSVTLLEFYFSKKSFTEIILYDIKNRTLTVLCKQRFVFLYVIF